MLSWAELLQFAAARAFSLQLFFSTDCTYSVQYYCIQSTVRRIHSLWTQSKIEIHLHGTHGSVQSLLYCTVHYSTVLYCTEQLLLKIAARTPFNRTFPLCGWYLWPGTKSCPIVQSSNRATPEISGRVKRGLSSTVYTSVRTSAGLFSTVCTSVLYMISCIKSSVVFNNNFKVFLFGKQYL